MTGEEAIKILEEIIDEGWLISDFDKCTAIDACEMAIEALKQTRWIPVSEKMPEETEWIGTKRFGTTISDEVYITFETIDGKRFCDHCRLQNGKLSPSKQAEIDVISKGAKMIAWMPLPKPYEPQESEEV